MSIAYRIAARFLLGPLLIFATIQFIGHGANAIQKAVPILGKQIEGIPDIQGMLDGISSIDTPSALMSMSTGGSNGTTWGFGVGSAPPSPGAKFQSPVPGRSLAEGLN